MTGERTSSSGSGTARIRPEQAYIKTQLENREGRLGIIRGRHSDRPELQNAAFPLARRGATEKQAA
jgi:hypothetical protein